ncbi:exodeoxyribonuclease V subunit gamma [Clostridium bowmanii]|uniref:PD-(D/E)XK nuclease family protein n=1 Tax=Clostridium bowmanii TaxID=132925 RepID=UPI001C0B1823|nr:PD-(D/E)XK nuclease family protein [Clostridium bowmanii]MBU3188461.1 exodeoxyribonuclease V subunit gamma [Clostridium bowmanii]MCA1072848.1 exodeoxyribonuclease V subunit gamma [Clostridium bowmanii]
MSLRFIYGGAGKGKSTFCLEDIKHRQVEEREKPLVLLVPEQFSFQAEKNLIKVVGSTGIKNVQVLSFNRLAYKVFSEVGGITRSSMDTSGKAMLIHSIMQKNQDEFKVFSAASRQKGFVDNVAGAITEFKKYGISVEDLNAVKENLGENPLLIDKITDLSLIYGQFDNILNKNYVDPDDDLTRLYNAIDECDLDGSEFWLDEFTGFTPQQYGIIEKLYKKAKRVNITLPLNSSQHSKGMEESNAFYSIKFTEDKLLEIAELTGTSIEAPIELQGSKKHKFKDNAELSFLEKNYFAFPYTPTTARCKNIKLFKGLNSYSEIEHVAKDILRLCRDENIRFNKIAVVTRDLPSYEKLIKAIFKEYNIPIFIDKKKDITSNPLIVLITGAVEIFTKNFSYEAVFRYLKTGLLDIKMENIDILENFVIAAGIRGKRKWTEAELWQEKIEFYFKEYYINKAVAEQLQKDIENTKALKTEKSEKTEEFTTQVIKYSIIEEIKNPEAEQNEESAFEESEIPAKKEESEAEKIEATIKILNDTREAFIKPLIELNEKLRGKNTTIKICTALFEFLENIKVDKTIELWIETFKRDGAQEQVTEYSKIWNLVNELLDQMVDVLGKEILTLEDFVKILSLGFSKHQMGLIPPALDGVAISSVERIKSHDISALYIIGVNDGVFPKANKEEGIFTDSDRIILKENNVELANDTKTEVFNEQYLIYATITIPSKYLNISYPIADYEGKTLRPSIIISRFKSLFKGLIEESNITEYVDDSKEDRELREVSAKTPTFNGLIFALRKYLEEGYISPLWIKVYKWFQNEEHWKEKSSTMFQGFDYKNEVKMLEKEKVKLLYGAKNYFSVSRIEKYEECPFAYFVQYGLKAKERKTFTFSSPDLGSFMHSVLDNFSKLVDKSEIKWADLNKDWCEKNIATIVEMEAAEGSSGYILNSSPRYKYFTERLKRVLKRTILVIVEQMKNSGFEPFGYEVSFGFNEGDYPPIQVELSTGEIVNLVGRIDRVDKLINEGEEFYRIIDYKSGNKDFKLSDVYYGLQIQLLTYLDAMLTNESQLSREPIFPAGILYFKIDDPVIKAKNNLDEEELERAIMKALKMKGLLLADTKIIREMDRNIQGASLVVPASIKKDGELGSRSSVATVEQFNMLLNHVKENLISTCEEMLSGEIDIKPYKKKDITPCSYCEYTAICQFDPTLKENNYKIIKDRKDQEIWELLSKESVDPLVQNELLDTADLEDKVESQNKTKSNTTNHQKTGGEE